MSNKIVRIALAGIMVLGFASSCEEEKDMATTLPGSDAVALVMGDYSTRADAGAAVHVNTYTVEADNDGNSYTFEEVVTEMDDMMGDWAATRGTPAYTQNVQDVYGTSFFGVIYNGSTSVVGDGAFSVADGSASTPVWRREVGFNPWSSSSQTLHFYLRMPENQAGVSNLKYSSANNVATPGSVEFDYSTPATAGAQQDILFATRALTETDYLRESRSIGGASVLFRHALTGVKFAIGNNTTLETDRRPSGEVQTFITKVKITGLYGSGHAVFNPVGNENASQVDDTAEHTSAGSFTWGSYAGADAVFTQEYGDDDIQNFVAGDQVNAPSSFYQAGAAYNLNKADASLTFWVIPQAITANLKVEVTFKIWDGAKMGEEGTLTLNLGTQILAQDDSGKNYTNKTWQAGQLRTFMLKPNCVDVDITDEVTGYKKTDVAIRNTGNVPAFIRAHIVANWFGKKDNDVEGIALGYSNNTGTAFVQGWKMETATTDNYHGAFTNLPGSGWVKNDNDGFYYYISPVAPGQLTGTPLFTKYELNTTNVPRIWYTDGSIKEFSDVHMVMEIPVQAIMAKDGYSYTEAWAEAGVTF